MELGCWSVTAHHRVEKKNPPSSDSSALHVTSVPIEESRHRRCLRTKNTPHDKSHVRGKRKELCQWRYGRMKRNERLDFKLPRKLKLKRSYLDV